MTSPLTRPWPQDKSPSIILRSIGLDIISFLFRHIPSLRSEEKKIVATDSRKDAITRCLIHVPPGTVSLCLIFINLKGYYIGEHLGGANGNDHGDSIALAFIQIAAKIQELMIIASLAVVVMHSSLAALVSEQGLPLGITTSPFSFARVSYFWSPALWGGFLGMLNRQRRGIFTMVCLLLASGLLSITAGPASAVLMLPRINTWHQFTTLTWLNGSTNDLWPERLTKEHLGPARCSKDIVIDTGCVSAGLTMLDSYLVYAHNDKSGFQILTQEYKWPRNIEGTPVVKDISAEAWTLAPHVATSKVLTDLWSDPHWQTGRNKSTGLLSGETTSKAAVVRTVCSPDIQNTRNDTYEVMLPVLPEYNIWSQINDGKGDSRRIRLSHSLWSNSNASLINSPYLTTVFVQPDLDMAAVTTGVIVVGSLRKSGDRFVLSCSVDARWNHALHTMTASKDNGIGNSGNPISAKLSGRNKQTDLRNKTLPINDGSWRHISADKDWLEGAIGYPTLFNDRFQPHAASDQGTKVKTTALGMLIMTRVHDSMKAEADLEDWLAFKPPIESVISTAFADALSRTGSFQQSVTNTVFVECVTDCHLIPGSTHRKFRPGPPAPSLGVWTPLSFNGMTTGYAYKASRPTDYISMAILALYVMIALLHTIFCLVTHRTFLCWDSIEELILLAKASEPVFDTNKSTGSQINTSSASSVSESDQISCVDWQRETESKGGNNSNNNFAVANTSSGIYSLSTMSLRLRIKSVPKEPIKSSETTLTKAEESGLGNAREELQLLLGDYEGQGLDTIRAGVAYGQC